MMDVFFFNVSAFIFGAIVGSFANVCIHRLPLGESLVFPPSRCPFCKTKIPFYDNIPLVSYIVLVARCRYCGVHIPFRYFLVELLCALSSLFLYAEYGFGVLFLVYFALVVSLIIVSFIDLAHRIIPNSISIPGVFLGLSLSFVLSYSSIAWPVSLLQSFIGALVGGGSLLLVGTIYTFLTGREGIGLGDVKLLAMIGAFFGWKGAFFAIIIGSILGLLVSLPVIISRKAGLKYPIPFGPFLAIGSIIYFWGLKNFLDAFF